MTTTTTNKRIVRWGILGTGKVAHDFVTSLRTIGPSVTIQAIASRSIERAERFCRFHGGRIAYGTYRELYQDESIDIVYVATIHPMHFEQVKACLESGKHVLCEKPMTCSSKETSELQTLAKRKNLLLQEGMWTRFFPAVKEAKRLLRNDTIGRITLIRSSFGVSIDLNDTSHRVLDPKTGGGSIFDLGVYPIGHALLACGKRSTAEQKESDVVDDDDDEMPRIVAAGTVGRTGVEVSANIALVFRERAIATLLCSVDGDATNETVFVGTKGQLLLGAPSHAPTRLILRRRLERGRFDERIMDFPLPTPPKGATFHYPNSMGFRYEAEAVHRAIQEGRTEPLPEYDAAESLTSSIICEEARRQIGVIREM